MTIKFLPDRKGPISVCEVMAFHNMLNNLLCLAVWKYNNQYSTQLLLFPRPQSKLNLRPHHGFFKDSYRARSVDLSHLSRGF